MQCIVTCACIRICLQSVLRYTFLILVPIILTLYLREQGCEDPWLFFRSQKGSASKNVWKTLLYMIHILIKAATDCHGRYFGRYFLNKNKYEPPYYQSIWLTLRWLMSYIYGATILDVSRSHTTTQHSR